MKNVLIVCAFVFVSFSLFAQSVSLEIKELSGSPIVLESANLEMVFIKNPRSQGGEVPAYVITRKQNELSAAVLSAITTGRAFEKAVLVVKLANGQQIIHDLNKVSMSTYTSINQAGKTPTETFYIQFLTDVIRETKK